MLELHLKPFKEGDWILHHVLVGEVVGGTLLDVPVGEFGGSQGGHRFELLGLSK